jgi:predicted nucleic acid-binding Zn ribbon protein
MPNYDYECTECGREIEISHPITEAEREHEKHIKKGGNGEPCEGKLKRNISKGGTFALSGSGWTPKNYA